MYLAVLELLNRVVGGTGVCSKLYLGASEVVFGSACFWRSFGVVAETAA